MQVLTMVICVICIFSTTIVSIVVQYMVAFKRDYFNGVSRFQGGLKAVVLSDAVHSFFMSISIAIVIVMGCVQAGGIGNVIKANREGDRMEFFKQVLDVHNCCGGKENRFSNSNRLVFYEPTYI